jgi:hypothetical protein
MSGADQKWLYMNYIISSCLNMQVKLAEKPGKNLSEKPCGKRNGYPHSTA